MLPYLKFPFSALRKKAERGQRTTRCTLHSLPWHVTTASEYSSVA